MSVDLTVNENSCIGYPYIHCGDVNRFDVGGGHQRYFWYSEQSTGISATDIYNWLTSNKTRGSYGTQYLDSAYNDPNGTYANNYRAQYSWAVGDLMTGGIAFACDNQSKTQIKMMWHTRNADGTTKEARIFTIPLQVGVGSGSNEAFTFYICDKYYQAGTLTDFQPLPHMRAYNIERVEFPVLQPLYTVTAESSLVNMGQESGNDITIIGVGNIQYRKTPSDVDGFDRLQHSQFMDDLTTLAEYTPDPNEGGGGGGTGGGGGKPRTTTPINDFELPPNLLLNSGIIKIFTPTATEMQNFTNFIYSSADDIIANFKKIWANPMDSIISLSMIPCYAPSTTREHIKFCGIDSGVESAVVSAQFITIDCGYIDVGHEYNTFLDYSDFTRVKMYLPFVGIVDLNADDVIGSRVTLKYNIDLFTGESVAYLRCHHVDASYKLNYNAPLYAWDANVVYSVPLSGNNWQQLYNGVAKVITNGVGGAISGGGVGAVLGVASEIGNFATTSKVSVTRGGSLKANGGFMSGYLPYLIIESPISSLPKQGTSSAKYRGLPCDMLDQLQNFHGYTEIEDGTLHLKGMPNYITDEEIEMIHTKLTQGVILP